jgi:hypothetical protein
MDYFGVIPIDKPCRIRHHYRPGYSILKSITFTVGDMGRWDKSANEYFQTYSSKTYLGSRNKVKPYSKLRGAEPRCDLYSPPFKKNYVMIVYQPYINFA